MIADHHKEFAKALVALAREHKMGKIQCQFEEGVMFWLEKDEDGNRRSTQEVHMRWSEGRHGASSNISLSAQTSVHEHEEIKY